MRNFDWYLWKGSVDARDFKFITSAEFPSFGFASLYGVDAETATRIEQSGSPAGFKGCVSSPFLWIDADSTESADRIAAKLETMGVTYDAYESGSKGYHFRIPRFHAPSSDLPAKDKLWVLENFGQDADLSIYTHLHLFRIEGTIHEKTGKSKKHLFEFQGKRIDLTGIKIIERAPTLATSNSTQSIFDNRRVMACTMPAENGKRHLQLVKAAYALRDHGMSPEFSYEWLLELNKRFREPKNEDEIEKIVRDIFVG